MAIRVKDAIPPTWKSHLIPGCPLAIGLDPATTDKGTSNPTGLTVTQNVGMDYIVRLIARFKSADPEHTKAILDDILDLPHGLRPRRLVIDASSEKFFALEVKRHLAGKCRVELISSTQTVRYRGENLPAKVYLGNLLINTLEDSQIWLPEAKWVQGDWRLVKRDRGSFATEVDSSGGHGDTFDSTKLSLHGLISTGGPAEASAAAVGQGHLPRRGGAWPPMRPNRSIHRTPRLHS